MKTFPQYPQIVIIGGNFGWVLAKTLAAKYKDWQILFLMRDETKVAEARASRIVDKFFGQKIRQSGNTDAAAWIALPENVSFYSLSDFRQYFRGKIQTLFIPAISSNSLREALGEIVSAGVPLTAFDSCVTFSVSKGMEVLSQKFAHEVIDEVLHINSVVGLGGNLAFDLGMGDPMLMELAGPSNNTSRIAELFRGSSLKTLQSRNRRKLGLAGPMKNIHSLATGMASEIYGNSSVASIATLGLAEYEQAVFVVQFPQKLRRLACQLQKIPFNFRSVPIGGGVMSDYHLFRFTRNFEAGQNVVRHLRAGKDIRSAMSLISKEKTIESFASIIPTRDFLRQLGVHSPIIEIMSEILTGNLSPEEGINQIMESIAHCRSC